MKQEQTAKLKLKQTFPLTIKRLGINGEGVGYFKRQVVFVPGALPGEEITAEATKVNPKFAEAKIKKSVKNRNSVFSRHARYIMSVEAASCSISGMISS